MKLTIALQILILLLMIFILISLYDINGDNRLTLLQEQFNNGITITIE